MISCLHVGVIGAGPIAQSAHTPCLEKIPDVKLVALCDINRQRARQIANFAGIGRVYSDWREIIAVKMARIVREDNGAKSRSKFASVALIRPKSGKANIVKCFEVFFTL